MRYLHARALLRLSAAQEGPRPRPRFALVSSKVSGSKSICSRPRRSISRKYCWWSSFNLRWQWCHPDRSRFSGGGKDPSQRTRRDLTQPGRMLVRSLTRPNRAGFGMTPSNCETENQAHHHRCPRGNWTSTRPLSDTLLLGNCSRPLGVPFITKQHRKNFAHGSETHSEEVHDRRPALYPGAPKL